MMRQIIKPLLLNHKKLASPMKCPGRKVSPEEMPHPTGNFAPSTAAPTESTNTMENTPQFQIIPYGITTTNETPGQVVGADHFSDIFVVVLMLALVIIMPRGCTLHQTKRI